MAELPDLLDDAASDRARWPWALGGVLLLAAVTCGAAVRSALPPPPLAVALTHLDGTTLSGDSFVRLHVQLRTSGVRTLGDVRLTLGGTTQRGVSPRGLDDDGRTTVQVELSPACGTVTVGVGTGLLEVELRDDEGRDRTVRLDVPTDPRLQRLLRYPCA